jgi:epoxyqueuosine reductase
LRNVAVALGNLKRPEAVPALIGALDDEEALVRGHAAWALGQIGTGSALEALQRRAQCETDSQVLTEITDAISVIKKGREVWSS